MNMDKKKVWFIIAGILLAITVFVTAGFIVKVAGLNMLPMKYLGLVVFAVILLLAIICACFFLWQGKMKKIVKYVVRGIGVLLAVSLVCVDVVGIQMVNKFEETMSELTDDEEEPVKIEEFTFGVYVRAEDKAETLEDVKRYDFGYSLAYDRNHTKTAVNVVENDLDRNLNLEEHKDIFEMVNKVLNKELDAFILSVDYIDIIKAQEGYEDFDSKVKCVYEWIITSETQVAEMEEKTIDVTKDTFVLYISGNDTPRATTRANSDVNIMAVINPTTKQILLLNTPRDFYIPTSASPDRELDKLTHCGVYGVECSMETLSEYYDVDIKHYAQINFTGFVRLVDALGGITVYSEKEFYTTNEGYHFVQGANAVDGEHALAFVRERKQFSAGDHARGKHQMAVIKGMIQKMSSGSLLVNYNQILDSMGGYFRTNVSQEELSAIVKMQLDENPQWNIQTYAVSGVGENNTSFTLPRYSTYVMIPDENTVAHAKTLIQMVYAGETIEAEDLVTPTK